MDFKDLAGPLLLNCVHVEKLADVQVLDKSSVAVIGRRSVLYDQAANTHRQLQLSSAHFADSEPVCSFYDGDCALLFVGFQNGVTEVFRLGGAQPHHVQQLAGLTEAGVNVIRHFIANGNKYYCIGTNDALYVYESNLQLRETCQLGAQGVSRVEFQAAQGSIHNKLICGLTDGQVIVFNALSLEKICQFDVLLDEDEEMERQKPVLELLDVPEKGVLLITGDRCVYVYRDDFECIGEEQARLEEEASFRDNECVDGDSIE